MTSMKTVFLALGLLLSAGLVSSASSAELEATIFSYDGQDFVRTNTTLMKDGASAADTKLDRDSPAYKALVEKSAYSGPTTIFGEDCEGHYAPVTNADGKLTGALFVGVSK